MGRSNNSLETLMPLIDFDLAEHLEFETNGMEQQIPQKVSCIANRCPSAALILFFTRERLFLLLELLNGEDLCHPALASFLIFPAPLISMLRL